MQMVRIFSTDTYVDMEFSYADIIAIIRQVRITAFFDELSKLCN
jgi:hypothetical protein